MEETILRNPAEELPFCYLAWKNMTLQRAQLGITSLDFKSKIMAGATIDSACVKGRPLEY